MDIADISRTPAALNPIAARSGFDGLARSGTVDDSSVTNTIRALDAFRQELRGSLSAKFVNRISVAEPNYSKFDGASDANGIAKDALGTAQQLVERSPARAAQSIIKFRISVSESAQSVRDALTGRPDVADVDRAEQLIGRGLDAIGAAQRAESGTSVLKARSKITENSTIKIRTQEGDFVKLNLQNISAVNVRDEASFDATGSSTETSANLRQVTRVGISVEGDINADEQAAIQSVIDQASAIADEFFNGDLAAAFENAENFEFDAEQLQRVKLNFRIREKTDVSYAQSTSFGPAPVADAPASVVAPPVAEREASQPILPISTPAKSPSPLETLAPIIRTPVDVPAEPEAAADIDPITPTVADTATDGSDPLSKFFELVEKFLQSSADGFGTDGGTSSLYFSETFKLSLLRETIVVAAPVDQQVEAETAADVIDQITQSAALEG